MAFAPFLPYGVTKSAATASPSWSWTAPTLTKPSQPTLNELIARITAAKQSPHRSFIGTLEHGAHLAMDPVAWTFDKLERPAYGVAAAIDKGALYHHIDLGAAAHAAREGFMGREKTNIGAIFKDRGILQHHNFLRGLAGTVGDVALDPLSYTGVGVSRKATTKALDAASKTLLEGTAYAATDSERATRIAKLTHAHDVLKTGGSDFQHRTGLAKLQIDLNTKALAGHEITNADRGVINTARNAANAEHKLFDQKYLKVRLGPNSGGLNLRTPVKLPMGKLGDKNIPFLSKAASTLGEAFKPGYKDPIVHSLEIGKRHQGERLFAQYFAQTKHRFGGLESLSAKEQRSVLHFFEKPKGRAKAVVFDKKLGAYVLNPAHIARALKAGYTEKQIEFVKAMHDTAEYLAHQHKEYGLDIAHLGAQGKLYVPHVVRQNGEGLTDVQRNLLTKRGFVKARKHDLSVAELHNLHEAGKLPHDIVTNPFELLTHHLRSVSNQHADQLMLNHLRDTLGVPRKLVDKATAEAATKTRIAAEKALATHPEFDQAAHDAAIEKLVHEHLGAAHTRYSETLAHNNAAIKDHLENRDWQQTTLATVKRISQRSVEAQNKLAEEKTAINRLTHPDVVKAVKPLNAAKAAHFKQGRSLSRNLTSALKAERVALKGVKNSAYDGSRMRTIENRAFRDAFGNKYAFNHETADSIERLTKATDPNTGVAHELGVGYRKYLGKWKVAVTTLNPSYGVRNTLSDYWNMYLSGVPIHAIPVYGAKAAHLMRAASKGDRMALSKLLDAEDSGILSGLFAGDIQQVASAMEKGSSLKSLTSQGKLIKAGTKLTQDINRNRENWGRLTHYLYRLDQGHGVAEAADLVKAAHFDYEDLTKFEQTKMKAIAPFYTWSRKNIPFQLRAIVEHPGQLASFPQFGQEMNAAAGGKKGDIIPPYMEQGMYLKLPFGGGKYFNPMIGISDLQNATHPQQLIQNLISPAIKTPAELLMNKNLLTGLPIKDPTGYSRNPINDKMAGLLSLIPGSDVGETGRKAGVSGQMVHGAGANPYLTYFAGQTPLTNALFNKGGKIHDAQHPKDKNRALITELTGINAQTVDQNEQKQFETIAFQDKMKKVMKDLRAEGIIPPAGTPKTSAQQKIINDILFKALGG